MSYQIPADIQQMIDVQIASGRYATPDEVLRDAMQFLIGDLQADSAAIEKAIEEWKDGDEGMTVDEAFHWARQEQ